MPASGTSGGPSGNRARDHLANERTFLSWLRTSLGVIALAAAVARFGIGGATRDRVAVSLLALLGAFVLVTGTRRYYQVARDLEEGRFSLSRRTPVAIAVVVLACSGVILALLV